MKSTSASTATSSRVAAYQPQLRKDNVDANPTSSSCKPTSRSTSPNLSNLNSGHNCQAEQAKLAKPTDFSLKTSKNGEKRADQPLQQKEDQKTRERYEISPTQDNKSVRFQGRARKRTFNSFRPQLETIIEESEAPAKKKSVRFLDKVSTRFFDPKSSIFPTSAESTHEDAAARRAEPPPLPPKSKLRPKLDQSNSSPSGSPDKTDHVSRLQGVMEDARGFIKKMDREIAESRLQGVMEDTRKFRSTMTQEIFAERLSQPKAIDNSVLKQRSPLDELADG
ncbi:hypothetical protein DFQ30_008149 [Apophysomyces sp. BC1015]|nr:hypothetical protein DFQ30_008149 [Apophysomyces sp. BC1015]